MKTVLVGLTGVMVGAAAMGSLGTAFSSDVEARSNVEQTDFAPLPAPYVRATDEEEEAVTKKVIANLFDPSSGKVRIYGKIPQKNGNGELLNRSVVCGYMNAKNRFGGYVGERKFAYEVKYEEDGISVEEVKSSWRTGTSNWETRAIYVSCPPVNNDEEAEYKMAKSGLLH